MLYHTYALLTIDSAMGTLNILDALMDERGLGMTIALAILYQSIKLIRSEAIHPKVSQIAPIAIIIFEEKRIHACAATSHAMMYH